MLARSTRKPLASETVTTDIDELQRAYRMMELSRKGVSDEAASSVRMQRAAMEKLKRDNERLKEELALETRQARAANKQSVSAQIARLQDAGEGFSRKIEGEKRKIDELDRQIMKAERNLLEQRKEMGGVNASRDNTNSIQKQIRILENRLDKALVKFNEALAHNKNLRETIDNLRRERVVFDGIYKKLEEELHAKKHTMALILQESDAAYKARDAAQSEMMALKAAADAQQAQFEAEWSQLGQLIEKDRKLKDFMATQARDRAMKLAHPTAEEESRLRKKVSKGNASIAADKQLIQSSMDKVSAYEEAFAKIQKATKISDIDQLVTSFVSAEDQNFSLFNYVNDLTQEIERTEETIAELTKDIEKIEAANGGQVVDPNDRTKDDPQVGALGNRKNIGPAAAIIQNEGEAVVQNGAGAAAGASVGGAPPSPAPAGVAGGAGTAAGGGSGSAIVPVVASDGQRKAMLMELESKLSRTEKQVVGYEDRYQQALKTVAVLKEGIQTLFTKLGCESMQESEALGRAGVTETNMMQYLGIIELRTNQLMERLQRRRNRGGSAAAARNGSNIAQTMLISTARDSARGQEPEEEQPQHQQHEEQRDEPLDATMQQPISSPPDVADQPQEHADVHAQEEAQAEEPAVSIGEQSLPPEPNAAPEQHTAVAEADAGAHAEVNPSKEAEAAPAAAAAAAAGGEEEEYNESYEDDTEAPQQAGETAQPQETQPAQEAANA